MQRNKNSTPMFPFLGRYQKMVQSKGGISYDRKIWDPGNSGANLESLEKRQSDSCMTDLAYSRKIKRWANDETSRKK